MKSKCPVPGMCGTKSVIYRTEVREIQTGRKEFYTGLTSGKFKDRYRNHAHEFSNIKKRSATCLSEHLLSLKDKGIEFVVEWNLLKKLKTYNPISGKCDLCLGEKHMIIFSPEGPTLNKSIEQKIRTKHNMQTQGKILTFNP